MSQPNSIDFSTAFKETMDQFGLSSKELSESSGRSRNNISEIRLGKVNTGIQDFAQLLCICETLKPGFTATFAHKLIPIRSLPAINWTQHIDRASSEDAVLILGAVHQKFARLVNDDRLTNDPRPQSA
ncbi:MAG: hypothetical protein ACFBSE_11260 [Prochloraceae cyanobacterium]